MNIKKIIILFMIKWLNNIIEFCEPMVWRVVRQFVHVELNIYLK